MEVFCNRRIQSRNIYCVSLPYVFIFPWLLWPWYSWKSVIYFVECPWISLCLMFPCDSIWVLYFGRDISEIMRCVLSVSYEVTCNFNFSYHGNVNLHCLIKVVFAAKFLYYTYSLLLCTQQVFYGEFILRPWKYSAPH